VQPEGVNAGSAEESETNDEGDRVAAAAETRRGPDPEIPRQDENKTGGSGDPRMVGTPEPQEESGQDAGSL
jgi:hypothetical protein